VCVCSLVTDVSDTGCIHQSDTTEFCLFATTPERCWWNFYWKPRKG